MEKLAFFNWASLPAGGRLETHVGGTEEIYYITQGQGLFHVGAETSTCQEGDAIHIPAGLEHGLLNNSHEPIEYLVLGAL
jgi:quercetin dioxygenase-like cupin family protein